MWGEWGHPSGAARVLKQLHAALRPGQDNRLLQWHGSTPADTLIPERCRIHEALHADQPFLADVDCLGTDAELSLTTLLGTPAALWLQQQDGGWRQWHGHIARASLLDSDGGWTRYRLQLRDVTHWASLRRDTRIFQDQTSADIVQAVLCAHPQARLRLAVAHPGPLRAITTQYRETDWAFAQRLMAEEGWSWRIEHDQHGEPPNPSPRAQARHTLVIFDAEAARPDLGPLRFSRPGMRGALPDDTAQDTLTAWSPAQQAGPLAITLGAWDERQLAGTSAHASLPASEHFDGRGERLFTDGCVAHHARTDSQTGSQAVAQARAQARLDAHLLRQHQVQGAGAVRELTPGARFTLSDHFGNHFGTPPATPATSRLGIHASTGFSVLRVTHEVANNLRVNLPPPHLPPDGFADLAGPGSLDTLEPGSYRNHFEAAPAHLRLLPQRHAAPPSPGLLTAIVTAQTTRDGASEGPAPIHSDRDGRIRVQFPWQRGPAPLPGGLDAPATPAGEPTGHAPGDDRSGTWVRVLQDLAGPDWGAVFTPRPGTEVLVDFIDGDIDRPVVIGQLHNGQQGLPWPAGQDSDANHAGALSGWHHPLLDAPSAPTGANQWLIDDSQGQLRMRLLSYSAAHGHTELGLGHLVQQGAQGGDTRRGHWLGEGFYGHTDGWAVVRAGQGLLLSTAARPAQGASVASTQMDAAEAVAQLRASRQLGGALGRGARQQGALGLHSHDDGQAWQRHAAAMAPAAEGKFTAHLNGQDARKAQAGSRTLQDPVEAFARPHIHLDTPSSAALVSTHHLSLFSGQDTSLSTQGDAHLASQHTLSAVSGQTTSFFTHAGGIQAITASAALSLRAHTDAQQLWADQDIVVQSTDDEVRISASDSITLAAGQSRITLQGSDITFTCPGTFAVKGAMHEWGGGTSGSLSLQALPDTRVKLFDEQVRAVSKLSGRPVVGQDPVDVASRQRGR